MARIIEQHIACPVCPSSDAYCIYEDGHGHCYSCGYHYFPNKESFVNDVTYQFLSIRNISEPTFRFYAVYSKCDISGRPLSVGFTYPNGSTKVRLLDKKEFYWDGQTEPGLFGLNLFPIGADKTITITEGELDALSLYQVTHTPCVSVRSASSAATDCGAVRQQLNSYERILLAFDGDTAGKDATALVAKLFDPSKVYVVRFTNRKDANEYLQHDEGDDLLNLWHNSRPYLPENIKSSFADFKEILSKPKPKGIPYPFPTLTKMTYGIRTGETVLLKAPEKVGKTAIMHAILNSILKGTEDNVGAFFIEEPERRVLQAIASLELGVPVHLPDCTQSDDDVFNAVQRVVAKDDRLHVYSHFGTSDPDILLDTIRFLVTARKCRYIMFDHIGMAVTGLAGDKDERRNLEYLMTKLEMMVKELDFSLILVSHVNDFGQTRGSHYLTKAADIVIDAKRDTENLDEKEKRTIHLSIPYNRFCSATGFAGSIVFNPDTYSLREEIPPLWVPTSPSIVPDTKETGSPSAQYSTERVSVG